MRRRWKVSESFYMVVFGVWALGWLPIFIPWAAITEDSHGVLDAPVIFVLSWLGVVIMPAAALGLWRGLRVAWRERPRRVYEPVTTDLREQAQRLSDND